MSEQTAAVGYVRVSRVGGRGGDSFLSPELQREEIERAARREGLRVVEVLEELDASGGDRSRPLWNEAIRRVEAGEVGALVVWNLARFSRSVVDALGALERIEDAGGRLVSATEQWGDDPAGRMTRNILLAIGQGERDRARAGFAAATASAVERGIHIAGTIPLGYVRGPDRRLRVDPDAAPVVRGIFERRAKGWSWARLAVWAGEQGYPLSEQGVSGVVRNPAYLGQARYGASVRDDAHEAIVPRALWQKCQGKRQPSARSGRLTRRYLLQGLCTCANCGSTLYLAGGNRRHPYYMCRSLTCGERAYAQADQLDAFVLNTIELWLSGREGLDSPVNLLTGEGLRPAAERPSEEAWRAATFVPRPGGDDAEVEEAEHALEEARADLDGYLSDTTLRRTLGEGRYNQQVADYVAVVNKCEADLAAARERTSGSLELVGRLWLSEWGWHERKEWVMRMVRSVVLARGKEPLSRRCEVELR